MPKTSRWHKILKKWSYLVYPFHIQVEISLAQIYVPVVGQRAVTQKGLGQSRPHRGFISGYIFSFSDLKLKTTTYYY